MLTPVWMPLSDRAARVLLLAGAALLVAGLLALLTPLSASGQDCGSALSPRADDPAAAFLAGHLNSAFACSSAVSERRTLSAVLLGTGALGVCVGYRRPWSAGEA